MKKFLLLALLLGLPSPLFAGPTDGYKKMDRCYFPDSPKQDRKYKHSLWKKEHTKSKKWGTRKGRKMKDGMGGNNPFYGGMKSSWMEKAVDYQTAYNAYNQCLKTKK